MPIYIFIYYIYPEPRISNCRFDSGKRAKPLQKEHQGSSGGHKCSRGKQGRSKEEHLGCIRGAPFLLVYSWLYTIYRFNKTKVSRTVREIRKLIVCLDAVYK